MIYISSAQAVTVFWFLPVISILRHGVIVFKNIPCVGIGRNVGNDRLRQSTSHGIVRLLSLPTGSHAADVTQSFLSHRMIVLKHIFLSRRFWNDGLDKTTRHGIVCLFSLPHSHMQSTSVGGLISAAALNVTERKAALEKSV